MSSYGPRLAVRDRGEWIDAIMCIGGPGAEDGPDAVVLSKLSRSAAEKDRQAFEEWVKAMTGLMVRFAQSVTGIKVDRVEVARKSKPESN
jgi:hypothetical protein